MKELRVKFRSADSLLPSPSNPRTHSKKQIRQIADSIQAFGFLNPILTDSEGNVIAGHGRLEAAKLIGLTKVPTLNVGEMTEPQKRAYIIADNKLAELAGWDLDLLTSELEFLTNVEINFDVTVTGFDTPDIDMMLAAPEEHAVDEEPPPEPDLVAPPISSTGDIWILGGNRLLCGDALDSDSYSRLMKDAKAEMMFTDPPYNVPIQGHVSGLGATKHAEFAMASGEMSVEQYIAFLSTFMRNATAVSVDGALHFVCGDWRHMTEVLTAARGLYGELKNLCVWDKGNGGMGSLYRSQHELVFLFKNGKAPHVNNVELGSHGRYRTNIWRYPGMNSFGSERDELLALHPTVKPVALVADAILDCSSRGGIVLDPFVGSGSTIIAAERTGRCAFAIELDPHYVDVAVRRWQKETGESATEEATGRSFAEVQKLEGANGA